MKNLKKVLTVVAIAGTLCVGSQIAVAKDHYFGKPGGAWGALKTKISPSDASVWIDGEYVGHVDQFNGPGQELYLHPGQHEIRFSIQYYKDFVTQVTIEAGKTTVVRQRLAPSEERVPTGPFANVKIKSSVDKAAVLVNGRFIGHVDEMNGPAQWLQLMPGTHTIEVRQSGFEPFKTSFEARAGSSQTIDVVLQKSANVRYAKR